MLLRFANCSAPRCSINHATLSSLKAFRVNGLSDPAARAAQWLAALRYPWTGNSNDICLRGKLCGKRCHTRAENERLKTMIEPCGGMTARLQRRYKLVFILNML
jgi:hypothetical protein